MSKYTLFIGTRRSGKTYRAIEEARRVGSRIRIHLAVCFRVLWRGAPRQPPALPIEGVHHPSELCKCDCGSGGEPKDHDPACIWLAKMCRHCSGEGWCPECFGDGCAAERGQT